MPVEDTSSRTTLPLRPLKSSSRSNLQAEPSVPVRERRSAELHTMDDSDLSDGMNAQTDLSESLEADEDTDLSIAQDVYLAEAEMVIHESVDVWRSPESDLKSLSSVPETRNGFLVPPDSMDDVIGARSPISVKVVLRQESDLFTGFTSDLSTLGAFIHCEHVCDPTIPVHLFFELPSGDAVGVNAEVRWEKPAKDANSPRGIGVRFLDLSENGRAHIQAAMDAIESR